MHLKKIKTWEKIALIAISVLFLLILLIVALEIPNPTPSQERVFRTILALMGAGFGAIIPGFIEVRLKNIIRAGGALGLFIVVYFFNPASVVSSNTLASPSANNKYHTLLLKIECSEDYETYGEYNDYGYFSVTEYCGQQTKPGYWVWKNPYWYIWKGKTSSNE